MSLIPRPSPTLGLVLATFGLGLAHVLLGLNVVFAEACCTVFSFNGLALLSWLGGPKYGSILFWTLAAQFEVWPLGLWTIQEIGYTFQH